jgi:hypothetical protein
MTLPEYKPAQAQSKGRYIWFTQYTVLRRKYKGIVGISFRLGHQHQVSFCIHKYVTGKQTIAPLE